MNDGMEFGTLPLPASSPGQILQRAREAQGMDIETLATTLKVPVRKLQALEADRYDELQGATFVRALALAACRVLKLDPAVLLADLPTGFQDTLLQVDGGLNTPFREHHSGGEGGGVFAHLRLVHAVGALFLVGAVAMWLFPAQWSPATLWGGGAKSLASEPVAATPEPVTTQVPTAVTGAVSSAPVVAAAASVSAVAAPVLPASQVGVEAQAPLVVQVKDVSWVEVVDARDQVLLGRNLVAGERVLLQGLFPVRIRVGNVQATEVLLRGRVIDLSSVARDNVARLELN